MNNEELISRREGAAMRGIAILAIILHNYCHWLPMVQENEYTYTQGNADQIWLKIINPGADIIAQLLSFFGHYGVPVFVFLSAYGLVMKYEAPQPPKEAPQPPKGEPLNNDLNAENDDKTIYRNSPFGGWGASCGGWGAFLWQHYKKLFLMMIVGYTAFVMVDYMTPGHRHYEFWNVIGQLGMFSNFYADPDHDIWPGPYWYFGLMVQIYIVYRLILYKGKGSLGGMLSTKAYNIMLILLFLITIVAQGLFEPAGMALQWYRYNVMGSLPVFIAGLEYARTEAPQAKEAPQPPQGEPLNNDLNAENDDKTIFKNSPFGGWGAVGALVSVLFIFFGSLSFYTWMIVPFAIVVATISLVKCLPQFILNPLAWVGTISAAMFVCHPITRKVLIPISRQGDLYTGLILYLVATIVLAIFFKRLITIVVGSKN